MDPNLFHLDWERLIEVMAVIVVLSFFVERALALLFESRVYIQKLEGRGLKELIAFVVGSAVCFFWKLDALSIVLASRDEVTFPGYLITGAIIAGGSKASVALFRDILGFKSKAFKEAEASAASAMVPARKTSSRKAS